MMHYRNVLLFAVMVTLVACKGAPEEAKKETRKAAHEAAREKAMANVGKSVEELAKEAATQGEGTFVHPVSIKQPPVAQHLKGRAMETMDAGGYTYVLIRHGKDETWLAGPKTAIETGQTVSAPRGALMREFASLTLKRTFQEVYFVEELNVEGARVEPDATSAPAEPEHVVTFNAGLARNYVPYVDERLPAIIEELSSLDAEVVCLQEVWEERDIKAIARGTKATFPHNFRLDSAGSLMARDASAPSCTPKQLDPLAQCVATKCADVADTTGCVMKACGTHFLTLPSQCRTCLAANVSKPLPEVVKTCTSKGVSMSYDGANGLLILSRKPIEETHHIFLDSFLLQRVVLHAAVTVIGGKLNVFCTHLTTPIAEVEYGGKYQNWKEEQAAQVKRVIAFVKEKATRFPAVLLGDLNCGPANDEWEVEAEFADHFQQFIEAGFVSPYVEDHGHCTFCGIEALGSSGKGKLIDHALFLNFGDEMLLPERVLERNIEVSGTKVPLSDHYGVRVSLDLPFVQ